MTTAALDFIPTNANGATANEPQALAQRAAVLWQRIYYRRDLLALDGPMPTLTQVSQGPLVDYRQHRNVWFSREPQGALRTRHASPEIVVAMVRQMQAEGHATITVQGSARFRRTAWVYGRTLGLEVHGFDPTERDHERVAYLQRHRTLMKPGKRAENEKADNGPSQAPSPTPEKTEGTEPEPIAASAPGTKVTEPEPDTLERQYPKPMVTATKGPDPDRDQGAFAPIRQGLIAELHYLDRHENAGKFARVAEGMTPARKYRAQQQANVYARILTAAGEPFTVPDELGTVYQKVTEKRLTNQVLPIGLGYTPVGGAVATTVVNDLTTLEYWDKANRNRFKGFDAGFQHQLEAQIHNGLAMLNPKERQLLAHYITADRKDLSTRFQKASGSLFIDERQPAKPLVTTATSNKVTNDPPPPSLAPIERHPAVGAFREALADIEPEKRDHLARKLISYPPQQWLEHVRTGYPDGLADQVLDVLQTARALPEETVGRVLVHELGGSRIAYALDEEQAPGAAPDQMIDSEQLLIWDFRDETAARYAHQPTPDTVPDPQLDPLAPRHEAKEPLELLLARFHHTDPELLDEVVRITVAYGPEHLDMVLEASADPSLPDLVDQLRNDDQHGTKTLLERSEQSVAEIFAAERGLLADRPSHLRNRLELAMMERVEEWSPAGRQPTIPHDKVVAWLTEHQPEYFRAFTEHLQNGRFNEMNMPVLLEGEDRFWRDELIGHLYHQPLELFGFLQKQEIIANRPAGIPEVPEGSPLLAETRTPEVAVSARVAPPDPDTVPSQTSIAHEQPADPPSVDLTDRAARDRKRGREKVVGSEPVGVRPARARETHSTDETAPEAGPSDPESGQREHDGQQKTPAPAPVARETSADRGDASPEISVKVDIDPVPNPGDVGQDVEETQTPVPERQQAPGAPIEERRQNRESSAEPAEVASKQPVASADLSMPATTGNRMPTGDDQQMTINFEPLSEDELHPLTDLLTGHLRTMKDRREDIALSSRAEDHAAMIIRVLEQAGVGWDTVRARTPVALRDTVLQGIHGCLPREIPDQPGAPLERAYRYAAHMDRALLERWDRIEYATPEARIFIEGALEGTLKHIDCFEIQESLFTSQSDQAAPQPRAVLQSLHGTLTTELAFIRDTKPKTMWSRRAEHVVGVLGRVLEANGEAIPAEVRKHMRLVAKQELPLDPIQEPEKTAIAGVLQADLVFQHKGRISPDQVARFNSAHTHHVAQLEQSERTQFLKNLKHTPARMTVIDVFGKPGNPEADGILSSRALTTLTPGKGDASFEVIDWDGQLREAIARGEDGIAAGFDRSAFTMTPKHEPALEPDRTRARGRSR